MLMEKLLNSPGFLYEISGDYYYLGKWICKKCTNTEAADCVVMYRMCRMNQEEPDTSLYYQKIRAYSDFALEIPYDPQKIRSNMASLLEQLTDQEHSELEKQYQNMEEDTQKYC